MKEIRVKKKGRNLVTVEREKESSKRERVKAREEER